jgi:hypothetical protein
MRRTGRSRTTLVAVTAAVAMSLLPGCAGARNSLGTAAEPCFRALPPASDAVHKKGKLVGVRKISTASLQHRLPGDRALAAIKAQDLCVFAFRGAFQPTDVPLATNGRPGSYAVVAVTIKHPMVVAAFVVNRLPARFAHLK